jgi:hypothetical protein
MATLAKPLIGFFHGLGKLAFRASRSLPPLTSLNLSDHDFADLNLPSHYRERFEAERVREHARLQMYR